MIFSFPTVLLKLYVTEDSNLLHDVVHNFAELGDVVVRRPLPRYLLKEDKGSQHIYIFGLGNLSESPNQFKYLKNISTSRFPDQFSRNGR